MEEQHLNVFDCAEMYLSLCRLIFEMRGRGSQKVADSFTGSRDSQAHRLHPSLRRGCQSACVQTNVYCFLSRMHVFRLNGLWHPCSWLLCRPSFLFPFQLLLHRCSNIPGYRVAVVLLSSLWPVPYHFSSPCLLPLFSRFCLTLVQDCIFIFGIDSCFLFLV